MKNRIIFKKINWTVFFIILFLGIFTAVIIFNDLNTQITFGEEGQSRVAFRWGILHTIILIIILISSLCLSIVWKRIFPFNVPIAIIIIGLCYELIFLTFTIGWVGFNGTFGFFIALVIGVILIVSYLLYDFLGNRK